MSQKTPVPYAFGPNFSSMFNWGLRLKNTEEIFLASGLGAHDSTGTMNDIVRMEFTFTKDVATEKYDAIFGKFIEFLSAVPIKPAVGTLRVVSALVFENQLVEYEFWCAR